jgi:hypothetical protein
MDLYFVGLDPGRADSHFGIVICQRKLDPYTSELSLHIIHIIRYCLGTPVLKVIRDLEKLSADDRFGALAPVFVLDRSGAGGALCHEIMIDKGIVPLIGLTIISRGASKDTKVKKQDLITNLSNFMLQGKIRVPEALPHRELLLKEFQDYRSELSSDGSIKRYKTVNGGSDDLLDALAITVYAASKWEPKWSREPVGISPGSMRRRPVTNRPDLYSGNIEKSAYVQMHSDFARTRGLTF